MRRSFILAVMACLPWACSDAADQFTRGRLLDACNGTWNVCTSTAGCFLGDGNAYYLEGKFPGTRLMLVRTDGQADITVSIMLTNEAAVGHELNVEWNDAGCGVNSSETVDGKAFFREVDTSGQWSRTKSVYLAGDHLIKVNSDSTAEYLLKIETRASTSY